jgi:hypothetical protein
VVTGAGNAQKRIEARRFSIVDDYALFYSPTDEVVASVRQPVLIVREDADADR